MRKRRAVGLAVLLVLSLLTFLPVRIQPFDGAVVKGPLVVSLNWPEATSLETWTRDVMRLEKVENASETAQGKAFFKWLRLFSKVATGGMLQAFEGEFGQEKYVLDAHKNLFVYGWGYCDTHSRIAEAAWAEFKRDPKAAERVVVQHDDGSYHTMFRLRMDGLYGAFDAKYGYYLIERDAPAARILDWAEVGLDRNIVQNKGFKFRSGPFFEHFGREWDRALLLQPVYYATEEDWVKAGSPKECVFGNSQYQMGTRFHDMSFSLPHGSRIERYWDNSARMFYVPAGFSSKGEELFRLSGRFYRVTETMLGGNWVKNDPNYLLCAPYVTRVPTDEGYNPEISGGRTIGQAWGRISYEAPLREPYFLQSAPTTTNLQHSTSPPYLRPPETPGGGEAVFDFYSPYVLVDGTLRGQWIASALDVPTVAMRVLLPKPGNESQPDVWSEWQALGSTPGSFVYQLGRSRFDGKHVSIHGIYRFQIRITIGPNPARTAPVGLSALSLEAYFENGIMSIPRIMAGQNQIQFKVRDASLILAPIKVTYNYETAAGKRRHEKILMRVDFQGNVAAYRLSAPGLTRCDSLVISY